MPIGPLPRTFNWIALQGGEAVNNYCPDGLSQTNSSAKAIFINQHIFLHALKSMAIEFAVRHRRSVSRSAPHVSFSGRYQRSNQDISLTGLPTFQRLVTLGGVFDKTGSSNS